MWVDPAAGRPQPAGGPACSHGPHGPVIGARCGDRMPTTDRRMARITALRTAQIAPPGLLREGSGGFGDREIAAQGGVANDHHHMIVMRNHALEEVSGR